jgi:uncharacterized OB-fold protein
MEIPRHWRLKAQRYRLEGSLCPTCGELNFPSRPVCPHCIAQPDRIASSEPSVLPASIRTSDIKLAKRMIGELNDHQSRLIDH